MFTQPCFIRKNIEELRNLLGILGYKYEPQYDNTCDALHTRIGCSYGQPHFVDEHYEDLVPNDDFDGIDCGTNSELFLAIAALRDDSDKFHWFTDDENWVFCDCIKFSSYWAYNDVTVNLDKVHKATVQELIEHFK